MPLQIQCTCGKLLRVKDELAGKKARCPGCKAVLEVPELTVVVPEEDDAADVAVTTAPPKIGAARSGVDEEEDDEPRVKLKNPRDDEVGDDNDEDRRRRRSKRRFGDDDDDDDDDEPRPRRSRRRDTRSGNAFEPSKSIIAGILLMVGASIWCIAGLIFDYFFFYPPILFIIGIVAVVRGAITRE